MGEVLGNIAGLQWRQRVEEPLSVAAAMPGMAVIPAVGTAPTGVTEHVE